MRNNSEKIMGVSLLTRTYRYVSFELDILTDNCFRVDGELVTSNKNVIMSNCSGIVRRKAPHWRHYSDQGGFVSSWACSTYSRSCICGGWWCRFPGPMGASVFTLSSSPPRARQDVGASLAGKMERSPWWTVGVGTATICKSVYISVQ